VQENKHNTSSAWTRHLLTPAGVKWFTVLLWQTNERHARYQDTTQSTPVSSEISDLYCLSVILLLRVTEQSWAITFLMCIV